MMQRANGSEVRRWMDGWDDQKGQLIGIMFAHFRRLRDLGWWSCHRDRTKMLEQVGFRPVGVGNPGMTTKDS